MGRKIVALAIAMIGFSLGAADARAATGFEAGRIIDDGVFTNSSTMSASDIQAFLNSKVAACDNWGTKTSEYGGPDYNGDGRTTRAEYARSAGVSTPFTCLKDYSVDGRSAAQIIYDVSQKYRINPQVMIVLLQKEQGLITDEWPFPIQYKTATGYGCPDTAPCDTQYYGLANQLDWAGTMFRAILDNSSTWYTPYELGNNYIQYNPESSCGGSTVFIQNRSTQALYNYTPYQPNQGALDAGWGTAYCGAYGNRNFYLYFTSWFGSTRAQYSPLEVQRWMKTKGDIRKQVPGTGEYVDGTLPSGTQLKFVDKIKINDIWYLRTAYDRQYQHNKGIALSDIEEITYVNFDTPRYMELTTETNKINPRSNHQFSQIFSKGQRIKFTQKIEINGQMYYRSAYDVANFNDQAIPADRIAEIKYMPFETPRFMRLKSDTQKVDPATGAEDATVIPQGTQLRLTTKTQVNGSWYYRTEQDTTTGTRMSLPATSIEDIAYTQYPSSPYWMQLRTEVAKVRPSTGETIGTSFPVGMQVQVSQTITVNGKTFYRTQYDTINNIDRAISAESFQEIPYVAFENPRQMQLRKQTRKVTPKNGQEVDSILAAGTALRFETKILIDGVWYARTAYDTANGFDKAIPLNLLY